MKNKNAFLAVLLLAVPFIYLAGLWSSLPARVPMHFNVTGTIDKYGTKNDLLTLVTGISVASASIYFILSNLHRLRKKAPVENRSRMQKIALAILSFMTVVLCWLLYIMQKGVLGNNIKFILAAVFLLVAVIGNYMPNLKPNYFAGFRLPWTLHNETNWRKTHHLAGQTWFAGGLFCMLVCLLLPLKVALIVCGSLF